MLSVMRSIINLWYLFIASVVLTANDAQLLASHTRALRKEASVSQLIGDQVSDLRGLWRFSLCDGPCCGGDKVLKLNRYTWTDDIRNIFLEAIESSALSGKFELKYCLYISVIASRSFMVKLTVVVFLLRSSSQCATA